MFFRAGHILIACSLILSLPALAQTAAQAAKTSTPPAAQKVRCKRYVETGSLARMRKECHTDAEWGYLAEANRDEVRHMLNSPGAPGQIPQ